MKTKVILLVGPSGSGVETLLNHTKNVFSDRINFVKKYITRETDMNENNFYIDDYAFEILKHNCYFASTWHAFGSYYGIPKRFIKNGLNIISVSRARIVDFENLYDNVYTINVTTSKEQQEKRLKSKDKSNNKLEEKLSRTYEKIEARNLIEFDNTLPIEVSKDRFIEVIKQIENEKS